MKRMLHCVWLLGHFARDPPTPPSAQTHYSVRESVILIHYYLFDITYWHKSQLRPNLDWFTLKMLCNFLAVPCVGVFGQMNQFPWEKDGSSSDICPAPYVQQVSSKKLFVRIFGKKRCLEQSFPKFSRNDSQWQLTNKKRERYLFCSVCPTSIRIIIPMIAVINILVINRQNFSSCQGS